MGGRKLGLKIGDVFIGDDINMRPWTYPKDKTPHEVIVEALEHLKIAFENMLEVKPKPKYKSKHILSLTHGTLMGATQLGDDKVQILVKDPDNVITSLHRGCEVRIVIVE